MATSNALFFTQIAGGGSNTDSTGAAYATASTTPTNGRMCLACWVSLKATTPDTPTLSGTNGFNGTWTQIGSTQTLQTPAGNFIGVSWFWSVATSGSAGVITPAYGATQLGAVWGVVQSPFVNATTPTAQNVAATDTSSSTALPSLTGSALSAAANWLLVAFAQNANAVPANVQATNGYNMVASGSFTMSTSDGLGMRFLCVPGNALTPGSAFWTASVAKLAFGIEVSQDGTGVGSGGLFRNASLSGVAQ